MYQCTMTFSDPSRPIRANCGGLPCQAYPMQPMPRRRHSSKMQWRKLRKAGFKLKARLSFFSNKF